MSRKRVEINLAELEKLASLLATDEEIAQWFGVSPKTIQRRKRSSAEFRRALETGRAKGDGFRYGAIFFNFQKPTWRPVFSSPRIYSAIKMNLRESGPCKTYSKPPTNSKSPT